METRLYNIFKSKNATEMTKPIIAEILWKLLQSSIRQNIICYHKTARELFKGHWIFNNF